MSGKFVNLLTSLAVLGLVAGCTSTNMSDTFSFNKKKDEAPAMQSIEPPVLNPDNARTPPPTMRVNR